MAGAVVQDLIVVVKNYKIVAQRDEIWYEIEALDGETLPEAFAGMTWVFHDKIQDPMGATLVFRCDGCGEFGCTEEDIRHIKTRAVDTLETKQFLVRSGAGAGITGNCMDYAYDTRYTLFPLPGETMEMAVNTTQAAVAAGTDGLMIEVHNNPSCALCDGAQSLTPNQFDELAHRVRLIREAVR